MRSPVRVLWWGGVVGVLVGAGSASAWAAEPALVEYFRAETAKLSAEPLLGITTAQEWQARRPELQKQMLEMLGLWPLPEKTDLKAQITGTVERPDFVIENVLFQSRPGLYVTGNLYRPQEVDEPLPAILYVCGHARVEQDGVIYGNKAHYQHHAAWFAANGYVCLVVDTLQLGELPGLHHGTHREGRWWWQSRGYTPAGVEAWNGVRAIDYLLTRPEVDPERIGVTGRSGGGATSWWLGAIDDRITAVVPVAGITDLQNHLVEGTTERLASGVIEGHCDCMFQVNTYRWDYPVVAALAAPKALLVANTDADPIFPEDGVRRVYEPLEQVYAWYDASDRLGLVITEGGHVDSEEIRHAAFAFLDRWLKGRETDPSRIDEPDRRTPVEELKVLEPGFVPEDNKNDVIDETFVPKAEVPPVPDSAEQWESLREQWLEQLGTQVFGGWPTSDDVRPLEADIVLDTVSQGIRLRAVDFTSQEGVRPRVWLLSDVDRPRPDAVALWVVDETAWGAFGLPALSVLLGLDPPGNVVTQRSLAMLRGLLDEGQAVGIVCPRGIGPLAWDESKETHVRRRFALLGQTLDGMRAWDVRRALAALDGVDDLHGAPRRLAGTAGMSAVVLWAAVFEPEVASVTLAELPETVRDGPAFLNLQRVLEMPQALALLYPRPVVLRHAAPEAWRWAIDLAETLDPATAWPEFSDELP